MPAFESDGRGDYTIVAPPNVVLANVTVRSGPGGPPTFGAYTGWISTGSYVNSDIARGSSTLLTWTHRHDAKPLTSGSIGSLAGEGGAAGQILNGWAWGTGGDGARIVSGAEVLGWAGGGGGGLAWHRTDGPHPGLPPYDTNPPGGVDGADGFSDGSNTPGEEYERWVGGGGGGQSGAAPYMTADTVEPDEASGWAFNVEQSQPGSDPAMIRVEWIEVSLVATALDDVLETATDLVQFVLDELGDASGVGLPSVPNSPETATTADIENLSTGNPDAVVLRGQPRAYTYYEVTVPAHAAVMDLYLYGAQGAAAWGGQGGQLVIQNVPVTGGEVLRVAVGGQGGALRDSSATSAYTEAGGATWVQRGDYAQSPVPGAPNPGAGLIAIAGGGGGGSQNGKRGGGGGGLFGADGEGIEGGSNGGEGGDQTNAGWGLPVWYGEAFDASGNGGDGWRGGGAGQGIDAAYAGGGGASSGMTGGLVATVNRRGARSGDGAAVLVFPPRSAPNAPAALSPSGNVADLDGVGGVDFTWSYTHPNGPQNAQTGWTFRREAGGAVEYWNDTLGVFQLAPVDNDGAVTSFRFPEGSWPANTQYAWAVRVRDTGETANEVDGFWSPWSSSVSVTVGGGVDTGASDYLELELLDHVFNGAAYTSPVSTYLSGFVGAVTDAGGSEPVGMSRVEVEWTAASGGVISNIGQVTLIVPAGGQPVGTLGVFDLPVAGNMLVHLPLDTPISAGSTHVFAPGEITVSLV